LPGYHFTANASEIVQTEYWKLSEILRTNHARSEVVLKLRNSIQNAVKQRLKGEKNIGTHVSGGLDSCGVSSVVSQSILEEQPIFGYSWSPLKSETNTIKQKDDEYAYIDQVSKATKIPVHFVTNSPREFNESAILPEFELMSIEHPIMKQAQKDEVSILFSGFGGDEFLSLSNRGMVNHLFFTFQWLTLLKLILKGKYKSVFTRFSKEVIPVIKWSRSKALKKIIKENEVYFKKDFLNGYIPYLKSRLKAPLYSKNRNEFILNLTYNYHIASRLGVWNYFGEKYGIMYTYPLLDKELLDCWFSMPIEYTYDLETSRKLFRDVFDGILIDEVRLRNSKAETERVNFTMNNRIEEQDFILSEYQKLDKIPDLEFLNHEYLEIELTNNSKEKSRKEQFFSILRMLNYFKEHAMFQKYY